MKNKNGFTLIELMAVVAILTILALIITPIIDKNIKRTKNEMYNVQIENIRIAGKIYYTDNIILRPADGDYACVRLAKLIEDEYLSNNIKNPKTGRNFTEEIFIQISNDNGMYKYSVCPIEDDCNQYK